MGNGKGKFGGQEVVIVEAVRTPIGRGHPEKGYYKDLHASNLLARTYGELIERSGIDPNEVGDVIAGCVQQFGPQGFHVARNAWLQAGFPIETSATTIDLQCGSAQQAVNFAAALIASGAHDVAIGSGVEHMGHVPMGVGFKWVDDVGSPWPPELMERYNLVPQGISAEMIADQWEIPRSELDELRAKVLEDPRSWIAQPVVQLSTVPTFVDGRLGARHVDLRPFAVNDGSKVWVLPGGLTRVALPEGELVVNSSQGGGSKDTWVLSPPRQANEPEQPDHTLIEFTAADLPDDPPAQDPGLLNYTVVGQSQQQQQQAGAKSVLLALREGPC